MNTKEFEQRKRNLSQYFRNREKWKENDEGELVYYKGKRNLKELKFILQLVFGDELEIISEDYYMNFENQVIGGSITGKIFVDADFNGAYQGTRGSDVYIRFTLIETAYFCDQSSSLDGLQ
ncbi:hypothetical protein EDM57_04830 [Brevibacillus gelatini]|uniref:Uncharacterized protein n=1 Tax=Brevibacillus gelatini TaxID=1655277 RepID=A0A3M8B7W5_9BACL|nr:hypothetical protein [Brevibacillus gelatini]RNB59469.1 hypothetical protein EDM57_04830 [Brevibacillus gelatini]